MMETQKLFEVSNRTRYVYVQGRHIEAAEALAEVVHNQTWVFLGTRYDDCARVTDLFPQKYRVARYSFGYSALVISPVRTWKAGQKSSDCGNARRGSVCV